MDSRWPPTPSTSSCCSCQPQKGDPSNSRRKCTRWKASGAALPFASTEAAVAARPSSVISARLELAQPLHDLHGIESRALADLIACKHEVESFSERCVFADASHKN